jgi:saccharopine dehydrogenase-like NADP-dependent oxidoreductase
LLDLKFDVTVLCRSSKPFPTGARVKLVDFTSIEDLSAAIAGQDAVIDTTFSPEVDTPLRLIDAAAKAGVYRLFVSL